MFRADGCPRMYNKFSLIRFFLFLPKFHVQVNILISTFYTFNLLLYFCFSLSLSLSLSLCSYQIDLLQ